MKFRKKPVVIEAMQLSESNYMDVKGWINGDDGTGSANPAYLGSGAISVCIRTLEGDMRAELGDWIIKGVKGEFYPCKPDIFAATYEPADTPPLTRTLYYEWQGQTYQTTIPANLDPGIAAEICAFRAGANFGDVFSLNHSQDGPYALIANGAGS